jgi:putative membrane protein
MEQHPARAREDHGECGDASGISSARVLRALLVHWFVLAIAFAITAWALSGMTVSGGVGGYLWVSAIFGIVNAIIGTLLRILTFPLKVLTLGLFSIVVNAILLEVTNALTSDLSIDHFFFTAIWAAIIMTLVTIALHFVLRVVLR